MTLVVALRGSGGLILAADSRGTIGDPRGLTAINDDQNKLLQLSSHCGIGLSGASELGAKVFDELKTTVTNQGMENADDILAECRKLLRKNYDDWFSKFEMDKRPGLLLTLVGYQKAGDGSMIPRTYLLTSQFDFAPQLFPNGNSLMGVPQYAVYLMHRFFDANMTIDALARLAVYLISETASQDPKVGGPVRIASITPESGFQLFTDEAVDNIISQNENQNDAIRQFFIQGATSESLETASES